MRLRDHYDWVVLGDHPGALLSGALAAKLGLSVIILPLASSRLLTVSKSGQHFDPESNFLVGLSMGDPSNGAGGLLGQCLQQVGVAGQETDQILVSGSHPGVATPGCRFTLIPSADHFREELTREFGESTVSRMGIVDAFEKAGPEIRDYWSMLPRRLTLDPAKKRPLAGVGTLEDRLKKLVSTGRIREKKHARWFSFSPASEMASAFGREDLAEVGAGVYYGITSGVDEDPRLIDVLQSVAFGAESGRFRGGMTSYREFLVRIARRLGVDVASEAECRRLFVESGRLVGVQVSNHGNMIGVGGGVMGCSLSRVAEMITPASRRVLHRLGKGPSPIGWKFTLALTVYAETIPNGMPPRMIWKEKGAPVLEMEVAVPGDFLLKDSALRLLFVRTILPFSEESLAVGFQRMTAARMFRQVSELMPFLEFHVRRVFPDFRPVPREDQAEAQCEFSEAYGFRSLDEIPDNLRCYSGQGLGSRSGIEGLFAASGESFPRLGTLGGTVAALESVAWIAHRCGLPGPMLQQ